MLTRRVSICIYLYLYSGRWFHESLEEKHHLHVSIQAYNKVVPLHQPPFGKVAPSTKKSPQNSINLGTIFGSISNLPLEKKVTQTVGFHCETTIFDVTTLATFSNLQVPSRRVTQHDPDMTDSEIWVASTRPVGMKPPEPWHEIPRLAWPLWPRGTWKPSHVSLIHDKRKLGHIDILVQFS